MKLYGLKTCDTCRKALKSIPDAELVDVRESGISEAVLTRALADFGAALVNTRSTTWRQLDARARELPQLQLLQSHPTLMKRPLIERDGDLFLGWTPQTRAALGVD
ncbi:arsenate reductase [Ruegeria sp. 2012CJ41-6]|uniref:Arsenate reductase n=1 Tax=Ruegeria spongiae TaxID=2942209 RepID=A0ABT0Q3L4_9RHOB|nr:ArsC/Spx/MgsR family protein [Ruegeria spongiae]MCL6284453.1 arsenate reductase [Ruegeria spongiae]